MATEERLLRLLGLAQRAHKLSLGMTATMRAAQKRKLKAILLAKDVSQNTRARISEKNLPMPVYEAANKDELGRRLGRTEVGVIGILDASFAKSIGEIAAMGSELLRQKQSIRERIESRRRQLKPEEIRAASEKILGHLNGIAEFRDADTVHCYVAWRNEVRTQEIIQQLLTEGRRVVVPVVDLVHKTLVHSGLNALADLKAGAFGIREPPAELISPVPLNAIDLVIVPGVAFDSSGNRIGYGGGYYDGFLKHTSATKIGLAYDFQVVDQIPINERDERVDFLVTERGVTKTVGPCA